MLKPLAVTVLFVATAVVAEDAKPKTLKVLFIGNSYTARHDLAELVEKFAEEIQPGLDFQPTQIIYGGRRLVDHWRLGTPNYLRLETLTVNDENAVIASLEKQIASDPKDRYAKAALTRHRELAKTLDQNRTKWDVVVLQSYRDDLDGDQSLYVEYAPRYADMAKANGARVVLYETTPETQNAEPLAAQPNEEPVLAKARSMARLANKIDATIAPMSFVALKCQQQRPDITLRFVNDAHLNKTMAYLTACTLYAAIFEESPVGASINSVTDIRYWQRDDGTYDKTHDRDNEPITQIFSEKDRVDLQRIAWEGYQEFQKLRTP